MTSSPFYLRQSVGFQVLSGKKNPSTNGGDARDLGLIPGLGRSPGEGNGYPLSILA